MRRRNTEAPIIIKKGKKSKHDFHGGNWKVAMADFMTSMFIFFLLLWLLNIVSKEQREGIADYFAPASVSRTTSGSGGILGGVSIVVDGTFPQSGGPPAVIFSAAEGADGDTELSEADPFPDQDADPAGNMRIPADLVAEVERCLASGFRDCQTAAGTPGAAGDPNAPTPPTPPDNINVEFSYGVEGFKITLQEVEGQPMFESGSSVPLPPLRNALTVIAPLLVNFPNKVKVAGHTDAQRFATGITGGRSNWELSSERANASRRLLVQAGLANDRFGEITGKADSEPVPGLQPEDAGNRRIDIILMADGGPVFPDRTDAVEPGGPSPIPDGGVLGDGDPLQRTDAGGSRGGGGTTPPPPAGLQEPLSLTR